MATEPTKRGVIRCVPGRDGDTFDAPWGDAGHDWADILGDDDEGIMWARNVRIYPTPVYEAETPGGALHQVYVPAEMLDQYCRFVRREEYGKERGALANG